MPNQILRSYSFSLTDLANSEAALEAACRPYEGRAPDAAFLCAGAARPGFFLDQEEASMRQGMDASYWVQAWCSLVRTYGLPARTLS
jgi:3-dehydrosphinganine reductase